MAKGFGRTFTNGACKCEKKNKDNWCVLGRDGDYGVIVTCNLCGQQWRTSADYISEIKWSKPGEKVMALSEVERLTRSVNTLTDQLVELSDRNKVLEAIVPDVETLLWFCDKHFENVRSNEKIATEKELTGLRAHTRLREIFPEPKEGEE